MADQTSAGDGKTNTNQGTMESKAMQDLRARILEDKLSRKCSAEDLKRLKSEDWWLSTFLRAHNYDVDVTYAVIAECVQWRNNFQVESEFLLSLCSEQNKDNKIKNISDRITSRTIDISILGIKPLLDRQVVYLHGKDLSDFSILWINLAQYRPGDTGFENVFVFWLERHTMETKGQPLTILLDMTSTSMKNMDFNIFKFMLHALKYYYPSIVQDMLVFESPTMLNASWRVVKSWLDPAHPQIHQVTRQSISQFVDSKYLPVHMGGEDTFKFTMDDLAKCLPAAGRQENGHSNSDAEPSQEKNVLDSVVMKRVS
ncbi:CRAL/TRIO domain protein [Ancylostoma caninum]|uniref:CRAL/TRIO domain protein n=1 Tax=Ancylostoma caninum TaxID=29170 RepID=A0A368FGS5_ANCCA|nr:CRAL/TRIO domain protein [Ancylostoma caninum]